MTTRKTHSNAWGEELPEELRWRLYDELGTRSFGEEVMSAVAKAGAEVPSRAGWYRFLARMRKADAERRIAKIAQSVAEAQKVADKHGVKAAVLVETLKTLAVDRAMTGDDKGATAFASAAASIWDRAQREREIELKQAAQTTRDEQLKLAREKFEAAEKRIAAVQAAVKSAKASGGGLTPETLKKIEEAAGLL